MRAGFHVRLTFTSVSEIIATTSGERRRTLLGVCRQLLSSGDCIGPQNDLLTKLIVRFEESPAPFDWTTVSVRLARGRGRNRPSGELQRGPLGGSVAELVTQLQTGGAFWTLAANLYSRVARKPADDSTIRRFAAECPPFYALMIALCAAQYERCVRPPRVSPSLRAGRNDTFVSVCLPYCHQFVTNDPGQLQCFKEVVSIGGLDVTVRSYQEFRDSFFVTAAPST